MNRTVNPFGTPFRLKVERSLKPWLLDHWTAWVGDGLRRCVDALPAGAAAAALSLTVDPDWLSMAVAEMQKPS